jgi:hypothetical protein
MPNASLALIDALLSQQPSCSKLLFHALAPVAHPGYKLLGKLADLAYCTFHSRQSHVLLQVSGVDIGWCQHVCSFVPLECSCATDMLWGKLWR